MDYVQESLVHHGQKFKFKRQETPKTLLCDVGQCAVTVMRWSHSATVSEEKNQTLPWSCGCRRKSWWRWGRIYNLDIHWWPGWLTLVLLVTCGVYYQLMHPKRCIWVMVMSYKQWELATFDCIMMSSMFLNWPAIFFSMRASIKRGNQMKFVRDKCWIHDNSGQLRGMGRLVGKLYQLEYAVIDALLGSRLL